MPCWKYLSRIAVASAYVPDEYAVISALRNAATSAACPAAAGSCAASPMTVIIVAPSSIGPTITAQMPTPHFHKRAVGVLRNSSSNSSAVRPYENRMSPDQISSMWTSPNSSRPAVRRRYIGTKPRPAACARPSMTAKPMPNSSENSVQNLPRTKR